MYHKCIFLALDIKTSTLSFVAVMRIVINRTGTTKLLPWSMHQSRAYGINEDGLIKQIIALEQRWLHG